VKSTRSRTELSDSTGTPLRRSWCEPVLVLVNLAVVARPGRWQLE
jgi:hypothetical protein